MKATDAGPCTSLLGPRVYLCALCYKPLPNPVMCLGLSLPPISAMGQGPSYTTEGPGDPSAPSAFLPDPQSSLAQGEGGWVLLS